jgi:hypothetical protein
MKQHIGLQDFALFFVGYNNLKYTSSLPYFKRLGLNCPRSFPCFTGLWRLDDTNNLPNDTAEGLVGVELRTNGREALQAL